MLRLGSQGLMVNAWSATMNRRFPSYSMIELDGYFGYAEEDVQKEYQERMGYEVTGIVTEHDLHQLRLKPTLFSIHGSGQADPFGIGYPADIARRVSHLYHWQPVGNYPASAFPMNKSVDLGRKEVMRLIADRVLVPGPVAFADYSQGSIIGGQVRNKIRTGELNNQLVASVSFGNPMRREFDFAGDVDPGGQGIDPVLERYSEPQCINLAAKGDLYTTCESDHEGEIKRAVFNMVFSRWTGVDSVWEQIMEFLKSPIVEGWAAFKAAMDGILFVLRGTGPHVKYHVDQCAGTGETYYEHAITHLVNVAEARLRKIAN